MVAPDLGALVQKKATGLEERRDGLNVACIRIRLNFGDD
jgi:hypothetical protein